MNTKDLKELWLKTIHHTGEYLKEWSVIENAYSASGRHYHTLRHLCEVYQELTRFYRGKIPDSTVFALFYHDLVYNPLRSDNEKQSADYAFAKLSAWHIDPQTPAKTRDIILATTGHQSNDEETMLFLDADMSILGSSAERYEEYSGQVRKEFSIYPDLLYHKGRKKFIETTLRRDRIFLTHTFIEWYETKARINLNNELKSMS